MTEEAIMEVVKNSLIETTTCTHDQNKFISELADGIKRAAAEINKQQHAETHDLKHKYFQAKETLGYALNKSYVLSKSTIVRKDVAEQLHETIRKTLIRIG